MGPLVGVTFMSAVRTYGEASGLNGTTAGVGEAFSPLIGIWAPTFSACEVAAVFLLPFVAIRLVSGDRQSGALKIEMQHSMPAIARIAAKGVVLFGGWMVASLAPLAAALLWKSYGGSVYPPELASVALGHVLNAGLTIGARLRGRGAHRASVDGRHSHAERHRRHLDSQLHRRGAGRRLGAHRRLHAAGDGRAVPARPDPPRRRPHRDRRWWRRALPRRPLAAPRRVGAPPCPGIDRARGRRRCSSC